MKRFLIIALVIASLLSFTLPVRAMETNVYTCSPSNWASRCDTTFVAYRPGEITVNVQWTPTSKGKYALDVYDQSTATQWCSYFTDWENQPPPGNWTCHFDNGNTGLWHIYFNPYKGGKVDAIITITAETNP